MAQPGVWIGVGLLVAVTVCACLLAARAAESVEQFREERHERFAGKGNP